MRLGGRRTSIPALALALCGWAGCASAPRPMVDAAYASRAYSPVRVAVLPPDVFVVVDQVGDNDPGQSAALGQQVGAQVVHGAEQVLRARGYDIDLSARWDGIAGADGTVLVGRDELGALANGIVSFANSAQGGAQGTMPQPLLVAPDLAARVGWATQSDALLYINVKGAVTTPGKRAASIVAGVLIVFVVVAVVLAVASQRGGGGGHAPAVGTGPSQSVTRAAPAGGGWRGSPAPTGGGAAGAWRGTPMPAGGGVTSSSWRGTPPAATAVRPLSGPPPSGGWRGGAPSSVPRGAPVYRGGGGGIGIGVGVVVPLDQPVYTHDGSVGYDDPMFAGDEVYVSMTLISTYDGRVLWHARDNLDLDADQPQDVDRMVHAFLDTLPPAVSLPAPR